MEGFHGLFGEELVLGELGGRSADMSVLEQMSAEDVGERLRIAREKANLTQEDAAAAIDVARTTLIAIEKGQRRARIGEVQKLAKAYGTSVNALLRQEA